MASNTGPPRGRPSDEESLMAIDTLPAVRNIICPHCGTTNRVASARLTDAPRCGSCKAALFDGHPVEVTGADFERHVAQSELPLVVDFWAPWCAPCRMMAPVFERAARALEPEVRLAKLNTDEEQELAMRLGIRGIPTFAIFRDGREIARTSGAIDESRLIAWVRSHL